MSKSELHINHNTPYLNLQNDFRLHSKSNLNSLPRPAKFYITWTMSMFPISAHVAILQVFSARDSNRHISILILSQILVYLFYNIYYTVLIPSFLYLFFSLPGSRLKYLIVFVSHCFLQNLVKSLRHKYLFTDWMNEQIQQLMSLQNDLPVQRKQMLEDITKYQIPKFQFSNSVLQLTQISHYMGLFGWLNNQINMRQTDKRKSNLISYAWEPHIHQRIRDPAYMRVSETERENEVYVTF